MDSLFSNLWQRLAQLDGGWRVAVEGRLTETSPLRRYWRITLTRRAAGERGRIVIEDDMLMEAMVRAVCAAEAEEPGRMRTTALDLEAGDELAEPGLPPPEAGERHGRGAQQGGANTGRDRSGDPESGESSFFTANR